MADISVTLKNRAIFITINQILHARVSAIDLVAIQSWHYDENYFIEFVLRDAPSVLLEHDKYQIWQDILKGLEKIEW